MEAFVILFQLGVPVALLAFTYVIGSSIEKRHYADVLAREKATARFPVLNLKRLPEGWDASDGELVVANVVISVDYFKRFLAGLRGLVGGRVTSYEPLIDRARREAVLRAKEYAIARGFDGLVNLRLETTSLAKANSRQDLAGLEILAYATAVKLR